MPPATSRFVDGVMYPVVASPETPRGRQGLTAHGRSPAVPDRRGVLRSPAPGEDWGRSGITRARMAAPLSDDEIRAGIVGEVVEHTATIELVDYHAEWPRLFQREAD